MTRRGVYWLIADGRNPYEALAGAIIYRAAVDAADGEADAAAWLHGPGFDWLADGLGLSPDFRQRVRGLAGDSYQLGLPLGA